LAKNDCDNCKWQSHTNYKKCVGCEQLIPYTGEEVCPTCGKPKYLYDSRFVNWEEKEAGGA